MILLFYCNDRYDGLIALDNTILIYIVWYYCLIAMDDNVFYLPCMLHFYLIVMVDTIV